MPNKLIAAPAACYLALATAFVVIASAQAVAQAPEQPTPGRGQEPGNGRACLPHDGVNTKLQREYGERQLGRGISADGTLIEMFMGSSGSFTVVKTTPGGVSCVVDFGEGWQPLNQLESVGFTPKDLEKLKAERVPFRPEDRPPRPQ